MMHTFIDDTRPDCGLPTSSLDPMPCYTIRHNDGKYTGSSISCVELTTVIIVTFRGLRSD